MNKQSLTILILMLFSSALFAQKGRRTCYQFKGKITYERKLNQHKQMDEMMKGRGGNNAMAENMKKVFRSSRFIFLN